MVSPPENVHKNFTEISLTPSVAVQCLPVRAPCSWCWGRWPTCQAPGRGRAPGWRWSPSPPLGPAPPRWPHPGPKGSLHWMIATRTHHKRFPAPAPHHDEPGRVPRVPRQQGQEAERPGLDQTLLLYHHTRGPGVLKLSMKFRLDAVFKRMLITVYFSEYCDA